MHLRLEHPIAVWTSRGVLAAVFFIYGASKVPHLAAFAASIHNYRLLPIQLENALAITLPWIEILAAGALLSRRWLPGGALVVGGLTAVFVVAMVSALARGLDINCGCFTLSDTSPAYSNLWQHLVLDLLLLALIVHLWWAGVLGRRVSEGREEVP